MKTEFSVLSELNISINILSVDVYMKYIFSNLQQCKIKIQYK